MKYKKIINTAAGETTDLKFQTNTIQFVLFQIRRSKFSQTTQTPNFVQP